MVDIEKLNDAFGIEGKVKFAKMENDLVYLSVTNKYADAKISLYGAHIMSFRPPNSEDILWMSPKSSFQVGQPIRGGIPVCFPWFGPHKTDLAKPQHGFGRLMYWDLVETAAKPCGETVVSLQLCSSKETKAYWPFDFCAELKVVIGQTLDISLKVTNQSIFHASFGCRCENAY